LAAADGPLRAMQELAAGIVWTGSVQLSNAARLHAHTPAELGHAVDRMADHLANPRWDHHPWVQGLLTHHVADLDDLSLLPIDGTELAKPYARKMEYQDTIRDTSAPGDPLVTGYWCWGAYHWDPSHQSLCPLMLRPYSTQQPAFRSENDCWQSYLWPLRQATGGKGIWLSDRGGDRPEILATFLKLQPRWIIRLREDRALVGPDGVVRPAGAWADQALLSRPERGRAVTLPVSLPRQDVWQEPHPPPLHLLVPTYTFGPREERWVLLTCGLLGHHVGPRQIRHDYGWRWHAEDAKRLLGQLWHVERFLTRSFLALEHMLACVVAAGGFLRLLRLEEPGLTEELESEVLYYTDTCVIPDYRLARGLQLLATQARYTSIANNA